MRKPLLCSLLLLASLFNYLPDARGETLFLKGDLELLKVSGNLCGEEMAPGRRVPIEVLLSREKGKIEGYLSGKDIQTGHFTGSDAGRLEITYPDPSGGTGHHLSLNLEQDAVTGTLHEKTLPSGERGCNFDSGRITLVAVKGDADPAQLMRRKGVKFASQEKYYLALEAYGAGKMSEAVPQFEAAIRLLEQNGANETELIDPSLYLSIAFCTLGRYEDGFRLQEKAFAIPKELSERQFLRTGALVKLFHAQVERLVREGKYDAALALLDHVADRYPDLAGLQASRAVIMVGHRRTKDACNSLETALKKDPQNEVLKESLGWCLTQLGHEKYGNEDYDAAIALYKRAFSLYPRSVEAVRSYLVACLGHGKAAEAATFFKENSDVLSKTMIPEQFSSLKTSFLREEALVAEKSGKLAEAETFYRQALESSKDPAVPATDLARLLTKLRRYPEAERLLNERRKLCTDDPCRRAIDGSLQKEGYLDRLVRRIE